MIPSPQPTNRLHFVTDIIRSYWQHFRLLQRNARLFLYSNIILNVGTGALIFLYSLYLKRLGFDTDFQSNLLVVGIVGAGVGMLPAVAWANRFSARSLLLWSNMIGGIAGAGQILLPHAAVLYVTTFIVGISVAIYVVLTPPLLAATSSNVERAHLFSLNATLGFLTGVLGALLGGFLPNVMQQKWLLNSALIHLVRPLLVRDNVLPLQLSLLVAGTLAIPSLWPLILMDDAVLNQSKIAASPQPSQLKQSWWHLPKISWSSIQASPITRFSAYQACLGIGAGLFLTYINLYFIDRLHLSTATYGVVTAISTILLAVTTLGGPVLAERLGPVRGSITSQLCSLPLLVILALTTSVPLAIGVYLLRAVFMNVGTPLLQSFIMGCVPGSQRNIASSMMNISWQVFFAIGGVLSGYIIKGAGYPTVMLLAAGCYFCGMLLMLPWFGSERTMTLEQQPSFDVS